MKSVQEAMRSHRSIRTFTGEDIPDAVLREVLEEATQGASSSGNLNSYSVVLTREAARKPEGGALPPAPGAGDGAGSARRADLVRRTGTGPGSG